MINIGTFNVSAKKIIKNTFGSKTIIDGNTINNNKNGTSKKIILFN